MTDAGQVFSRRSLYYYSDIRYMIRLLSQQAYYLSSTSLSLDTSDICLSFYLSLTCQEKDHALHMRKKMDNMTKALTFLGSDQLEAMTRRRTEGMKWNTDTLQKAFILFFGLGNRAYEMITRTLRIPMPAIRSLHRYVKINDPHSDFFNSVFDTLREVRPKIIHTVFYFPTVRDFAVLKKGVLTDQLENILSPKYRRFSTKLFLQLLNNG